jgi:hypothetical protein
VTLTLVYVCVWLHIDVSVVIDYFDLFLINSVVIVGVSSVTLADLF